MIRVREVGSFDEETFEEFLSFCLCDPAVIDIVAIERVHPLVETSDTASSTEDARELEELKSRVERCGLADG